MLVGPDVEASLGPPGTLRSFNISDVIHKPYSFE